MIAIRDFDDLGGEGAKTLVQDGVDTWEGQRGVVGTPKPKPASAQASLSSGRLERMVNISTSGRPVAGGPVKSISSPILALHP